MPEFNEQQCESGQLNRENLLEGQGLKEITKVGWEKYREALTQSSYGEIADNQVEQIKTLQEQSKDFQPASAWTINNLNKEASDRAEKMQVFLTTNYGKDKMHTFVAHADKKKIMVSGRDIKRDAQGEVIERQVTRVYFSVPTSRSPEAFKTLFQYLTDAGVMSETELALNLENYQADSLDKVFENNTIVLYVYGNNPKVMEQIAKAITSAKKDVPEPFKLSARSLAKSKENTLKDFMIPLDDTTSFVEMPSLSSYHAGTRGELFHEITGDLPYGDVALEKITDKLRSWTPQRPGIVDDYPERRRYMPGLVFEKKKIV